MEITKRLEADAQEFFQTLAVSAAYDISRAAGREVTAEEIYPGFQYRKKMKNKIGRSGDVDVTITKYQAPVCYEVVFHSAQGNHTMSYEIESQEEGGILVHYSEVFEGSGKIQSLNYRMTSWIYKRTFRTRMEQTFNSIDSYIKSSRQTGTDV